MKLVTFSHSDDLKIGAVAGDLVHDFSGSNLPQTMLEFIALGNEGLKSAQEIIDNGGSSINLDDVKLEAPIKKPDKILGVGLNYNAHRKEVEELAKGKIGGQPQSSHPTIFNKQNSSVTGPYDEIHLPKVSPALDYEGELGFVIGKKCRHVSYDEASSIIYGYTIVNDVSVRDWQFRGPPMTMTMGKSNDTHCPFGPYIVTSDEVGDPHKLKLETHVNEELRQSSNTDDLIFNCFKIVEYISTAFTLEPGDLIATGTPAGSAVISQNWLKVGDEVKVKIEKLGFISNKVIDEPE